MGLLFKFSTRVKVFMVIFMLCMFVIFITAFSSYIMRIQQTNESISEIIEDKLYIAESTLYQRVSDISNMLSMISGYIYDHDLADLNFKDHPGAMQQLNDYIYTIANSYSGIMQLRILDINGKELIRAEREAIGSPVVFTGDDYLQDKHNRYYFTQAINEDINSIWISDVDLNFENGKLEYPYRPTIRFAIPIGMGSKKTGLVIINHFAESILTYFNSYKNVNVYLANREGNYIVHPEKDKTFTKYQDTNANMFEDFPFMKNMPNRKQMKLSDGAMARKIYLSDDNYLYALFTMNKRYLSAIHKEQFLLSIAIYSLSVVFAFFLTAYISKISAEEYDKKVHEVTQVKASASKLMHQVGELEDRVYIDPLTGAFNRRYHDERLKHIIGTGIKFGFIFIDIDHFKDVNDRFGHSVGDQVLQEMCEVIQANIRNTDFLVRWGGEEFCLILPNVSKEILPGIAEKLRRVIENFKFCTGTKITASLGVTMNIAGEDEKSLLERADTALYESKENGRNMVTVK
jgi:diguanylate cyclase (GGDEF)-like protein